MSLQEVILQKSFDVVEAAEQLKKQYCHMAEKFLADGLNVVCEPRHLVSDFCT